MIGNVSIKYVFYWGVAAIALLALAAPFPDVATMLAVILIVGVVVTHANDYAAILKPPAK
jgi:uncharacterized protein YhhL (DUF1145 family)